MDKKFYFVRFCLWTGIILDALSFLLYLFPNTLLASMGLPKEMLTPAAIYLLFHAAIFMLAWTILLIWTLRDPIQRHFVLLLTVLVTIGMEASAIYLLTVDGIAKAPIIPLLVLPLCVGGLFAAGYFVAGSISDNTGN